MLRISYFLILSALFSTHLRIADACQVFPSRFANAPIEHRFYGPGTDFNWARFYPTLLRLITHAARGDQELNEYLLGKTHLQVVKMDQVGIKGDWVNGPFINLVTFFSSIFLPRRVIDYRRAKARSDRLNEINSGELDNQPSLVPSPGSEVARAEIWSNLEWAISRIEAEANSRGGVIGHCLRQHLIYGLSHEKIAEIGYGGRPIPLGTVKSHIRRSKERLRELLLGVESSAQPQDLYILQ